MEKKNELEMIFAIFSDKSGMLPEEAVPKALACARCVFSGDELSTGPLDIDGFCRLVSHYRTNGISRESIEAAFRTFDPEETGYISASQLKNILREGEDGLSATDMQYLVDHFGVDDRGMICYKLLVEKLYGDL